MNIMEFQGNIPIAERDGQHHLEALLGEILVRHQNIEGDKSPTHKKETCGDWSMSWFNQAMNLPRYMPRFPAIGAITPYKGAMVSTKP